MTTEGDELRDLPTLTPGPAELADLELLLNGAFRPLTGFLGAMDAATVTAAGRLADGTPWPVPVTLTVPEDLVKEERLILTDPEGVPLAVLQVTEAWKPTGELPDTDPPQTLPTPREQPTDLTTPPTASAAPGPQANLQPNPQASDRTSPPRDRATPFPQTSGAATPTRDLTAADSRDTDPAAPAHETIRPRVGVRVARSREPVVPRWQVAGPVTPLRAPEHGAFRGLRLSPDAVRATLAGVTTLAVATRTPLHRRQLGQLRQLAERLDARVLVLPLLGDGHHDALVRAVLSVRRELPADTLVVPVPLAERPDRDLLVGAHVASAHGATHLFAPSFTTAEAEAAPLTLVAPEPWAYDESLDVWRPTAKIDPDHVRTEPTAAELSGLLDRGEEIPEWYTTPGVAQELRRSHPPRYDRGITVFFTGLSGSGKSTIARGLSDALVERGGRTVTLLDGDVVRRLLSAGLTFSREDRDLNIRRIGYVAAEITRHGGVAICAPIAPYARTRAEVRDMVEAAGDFVLVHVSTPLEECERRDRKGLYAKARAGIIPEFTGVSDPYEAPHDADLALDTSTLSPEEAVSRVFDHLTAGGWVRTA